MQIERVNGAVVVTTHKAWTGRLIYRFGRWFLPRLYVFAGFPTRRS